MEEIDDDFGDLYADVEAPVNSSINGVPDFTKLYTGQEDYTIEKSNPKEGFVSDVKNVNLIGDELTRSGNNGHTQKPAGLEEDGVEEEEEGEDFIVDNGSDSEDDFNIVLNDEDFPVAGGASARNGGGGDEEEEGDGFVVVTDGNGSSKNRSDGLEQTSASNGAERGNGVKSSYHSQYKYVRPHAASFPSHAKGNGTAGVASFSSMFARGDWEDNEWNQYKGSTSSQTAPIHATAIPAVAQSGYGFSLPWYRTILDVNIDIFEQKPWRHPGVDATDFFNFGFNEQSWKDYCNSVEQFRQQTSMLSRIPVYESSKYNQAYDAGIEQEKVIEEETAQAGQGRTASHASKIGAVGVRQLELPKGRAIQVEGSICERQPSMDVRRPRIRDTDVVIQIAVQDSLEDSPGCGEEDLGHMDSTVHETSENGDFGVDDKRDVHCLGRISRDEPSAESLEESVRRLDGPSALKRCFKLKTPSDPMSVDSDNHGTGQKSDVDGHHHQRVDVHTLEGIAEAVETQNKTEEGVGRNMSDADPCILDTESSLGERVQCSLSSSSFGSHSEASEDGVYFDQEKIQKPLKGRSLTSVTELQEADASIYSLAKDSKCNGVKMKPGYCKDSVRDKSPIQERRMRGSRRLHNVAESKVHTYDNDGASPMSETDVLYDEDYSSVNRYRRKERLHDFGLYDRKDIAYYRETELCLDYPDERFSDGYIQTASSKNSHRKGRHSSRDKMDPYLSLTRKWDEREHFIEQRITRVDNEILERDWYHHERGLTIEDLDPLAHRKSRQLVSKYSSYTDKEQDTQRRQRSDGHYFRKRTDNSGPLLEYEHAGDFMQEKYGRVVPSIDGEMDFLDEKYEKRVHCVGRKVQNSLRKERYGESPTLDMNYSWSTGVEDDYRGHMDHQFLSSWSDREPHSFDGRRQHHIMSPTDDVYDLRSTKRHGRRRTQTYAERCRDSDWFGSYNDAYDTENGINYADGQVHCRRRRYSWQSRELCWTEDEYSRHQEDELYDKEASFSHERISRHERIHAKRGSAHGRMIIDDKQLKQHRYNIREGSNGHFINRSSNGIHSSKHEQTVLRCRDSVVGEGKQSSGRCTKAASTTCNGHPESLNSRIDNEQTISMDFNHSHKVKVVQPDIPKIGKNNQDNEKLLRKFLVAEHNVALDLEEGQILTDELDKRAPIKKKRVSESAAPTCDVKKILLCKENAANGTKVVGAYDNNRILETRAKMEKRGERFKEPLTLKREPDKNPKCQFEPIVETVDTKQQRPARKRRWGGSQVP